MNFLSMDIRRGYSVLLTFGIVVILLTVRLPGASAWQLGWDTTASSGYYGIESNQNITGSVAASGTFFGDVSAFTDTSGIWHSIAFLKNQAGSVWIQGEVKDGGSCSNYCDKNLNCSVSTGNDYTDRIYWSSSYGGFEYDSPYGSCQLAWVTTESGSPTVNSNGQIDMFESNDNTASDFNSKAAWSTFDHALRYMDQYGSWYNPCCTDAHNSGALSSMGTTYTCTPVKIWISSTYAPPPSDGSGEC